MTAPSSIPPPGPGDTDRELQGWKEIADHIGKTERTARNWANRHGMPVTRHQRGRGVHVTAQSAKVDAWISQQSAENLSQDEVPDDLAGLSAPAHVRELFGLTGVGFFCHGVAAMMAEVAETPDLGGFAPAIAASGVLTVAAAWTGMAVARRLALRRVELALPAAILISIALFGFSWFAAGAWLPWEPIVVAEINTYGAKAGYLKACLYGCALLVFVLIPFHHVVVMSDARSSWATWKGPQNDRRVNITPGGAVHVPLGAYVVVLLVLACLAFIGINHLFDNLLPHPHRTRFQILVLARSSVWFIVAGLTTFWYGLALRRLAASQ